MRKLSALLPLILIGGLFAAAFPARAQTGMRLDLFGLEASAFPLMTAELDVYDGAGNFVSGLTTSQVSLLEDDQPRPLDALQERQPGVQFVVAVNPGPTFARRDVNAISRWNKAAAVLSAWAGGLPLPGSDDLSLVTTDGPEAIHLTSSADWLAEFTAYQPQSLKATFNLDTLARAISAAADPLADAGMKRVVLFITPPLESGTSAALDDLKKLAVQLDVHIYVWMIASQAYFMNSGAMALADLAVETGGEIFNFSGSETLPSLENLLEPFRHVYSLTYSSRLTTSGSHQLAAQFSLNEAAIASPPLTFDLDVQPPNPILVSPPTQIVRRSPDEMKFDPADLYPASQDLEIIIEFPDGHKRPLVRTALLVDGQAVDENTAEPFDKFTWDLSAYTTSGQHSLQVEAVDSLGLDKISLSLPVTITIVHPPGGLSVFLARYQLWLAGGAILMAGGVLFFTLFINGRRRKSAALTRQQERQLYADLVTQPVTAASEKTGLNLPWARRARSAPAYLVRLKSDGQPGTAPLIPLSGSEMTFGTDPTQATHILDDPSVAPLHARLRQAEDGSFSLLDQGSIAGTWVNFEILKDAPRRLEHGDTLHFGQLSFRFMLRKPPERARPRVLPPEKS